MSNPAPWISTLFARPFDAEAVAAILCERGGPGHGWLMVRITRLFPTTVTGHTSLEDFVQKVLQDLFARLKSGRGGLPEDPQKHGAWLATMTMNLARDERRKLDAKTRGGDSQIESLTSTGGGTLEVQDNSSLSPSESQLVERYDNRRQASAILRNALEHPIAARPRLAFLAWHCPRALTRAHVEDAAAQVDRARKEFRGGLQRPVEETWDRLVALRARFEDGVAEDDDGRSELAFILRSDHVGPPALWAEQHESERRTAMDTVRKWAERASLHLRERAGGGS